MSLIGLRHKTQWEKANHKVGPFWVPNTFLRSYFNSETISLIVRLMVLSQDDAIYMVPRPLQKLGGNSPCCVHSGDSTRDCEFNSYVSYVLTLIKAYSILVCTHITWFYCPFISVGDEWEDGRLHSSPSLLKFIPPTHNWCHYLWWALSTLKVCHQSTKVHLGLQLESWPT